MLDEQIESELVTQIRNQMMLEIPLGARLELARTMLCNRPESDRSVKTVIIIAFPYHQATDCDESVLRTVRLCYFLNSIRVSRQSYF